MHYPNRRHIELMPQRMKDLLSEFRFEESREKQFEWDDNVRSRTGMIKKYQVRARICVYLQVSDRHDHPEQEPDRIMIDYYYETAMSDSFT